MTWIFFMALIFALLALDLGVFHKKDHAVSIKESLIWTGIWIAVSLTFNVFILFWKGSEPALQFLTGYLIEKSLSMDNIFVFIMIFSYFNTPAKYQHKVLFWGILGAIVMRGAMILIGIELVETFHWIIYLFGGILIYTGFKMIFKQDEQIDLEKNFAIRIVNKFYPIDTKEQTSHFFIKKNGKVVATALFLVLMVINVADVVFAFDSIPAIFAITTDPFIVFTSNVFAILGLRALYFALAAMMDLFHYLNYGLAGILVFVGGKMVLSDLLPAQLHISTTHSLLVVVVILIASVAASKIWPKKK